MNKGAKAIFTCSPDFAYGDEGYPPVAKKNKSN
jgi:FKBP-type peptidyl-prolyl cis-trans isomerase